MGVVWAVELFRSIESKWFISEVQIIFDSKEKAEKWIEENGQEIIDQYSACEDPELGITEYAVL